MFVHATSEKSNRASVVNKKKQQPFFAPVIIQPKLTIGPVDDEYERQADAMADKVMRMSNTETLQTKPSAINVQRKCEHCEEEEKLQRKENSSQTAVGSHDVSSYIDSLSSKGELLPAVTRSFFEPRFGHDFSNVKIHTDSEAAKSSESINALAYTFGNNIIFNQGQFSTESEKGNKLLAHELTHVIQQGVSTNKVFRKPKETCKVRYKNEATKTIDQKSFINQLTINLDSWTPFLIDKIGSIINETFNKKEEIGWVGEIGHLVIETGKELLDLTGAEEEVKVGLKIGAVFINFLIDVCGETSKISRENSIESMKTKVAEGTKTALVAYQDDRRHDGKEFIENAFTGEMVTSKESCDKEIDKLTVEINEKYPHVSSENYDEIKEIAEELVRRVTSIEMYLKKYRETGDTPTDDRMKQYYDCKRPYLPENGMPTKEQEDKASEKCYYLTFPFPYEKEADAIIKKMNP